MNKFDRALLLFAVSSFMGVGVYVLVVLLTNHVRQLFGVSWDTHMVTTAPILEELLKLGGGLIAARLVKTDKRIPAVALVAFGYACIEHFQYLADAVLQQGLLGITNRVLLVTTMHMLASAFSAMGVLGLLSGVVIHMANNYVATTMVVDLTFFYIAYAGITIIFIMVMKRKSWKAILVVAVVTLAIIAIGLGVVHILDTQAYQFCWEGDQDNYRLGYSKGMCLYQGPDGVWSYSLLQGKGD